MSPEAAATVAAVLGSGDPERTFRTLESSLRDEDVARKSVKTAGTFGAEVLRLVEQRVGEALRAPLDLTVGGLILGAWTRYRDLVTAAEKTRDAPGQPVDVVLVAHEITSTHQPSVEVIMDGSTVATLDFDLTVGIELRGVIAVVDRCAVVAARGGDVAATASLALWGVELAAGSMPIVAGVEVPLGDGIPLLPPRAAATTTSAPATGTGGTPWWDRVPGQRPPTRPSHPAATSPTEKRRDWWSNR